MPAIIPLLWANRELIAKSLGVILVAGVVWWFCFHNPALIKKQDAQIAALTAEVSAAHSTINLLQDIAAQHIKISQESSENVYRIRTAKKPARTGYFVLGGVLPAVFDNASSAR